MSRKFPGHFLDISWDNSWIFPGSFRKKSGKLPGNFRGISWEFPGNFPEISQTVPGHFREISRKIPRHFLDISKKFPGHFLEISRTFPGNFREGSRLTPNPNDRMRSCSACVMQHVQRMCVPNLAQIGRPVLSHSRDPVRLNRRILCGLSQAPTTGCQTQGLQQKQLPERLPERLPELQTESPLQG